MPLLLYLMATLVMVGCASTHGERAKALPVHELRNVHQLPLPKGFKRVAYLPLSANSDLGSRDSLSGLDQAVGGELAKTKCFEVLDVTSDQLREWAGLERLTTTDVWPYRLKEALASRQVDGVVLVELTQLKGYPPIAVGLKARLVGVSDGTTYWACDEVFDLAAPDVYAGAKKFEEGMLLQMSLGKLKNPGSIDLSPSRLAKYAAYTMFATLPQGR